MSLSTILDEKGLSLLAEAIDVKGYGWGVEWIKNNSGIKSGDVVNASDVEIEKLINAQNNKMRSLVTIISKEENKIRRYVRAGLAFLTVITTVILFYSVIFSLKDMNSNKEIVMFILGALSAIVTQIISFYFGSSESDSKTK